MPTRLRFALLLAWPALLLPAGSASAQTTSAVGEIAGSGTQYTFTIRNTGQTQLQCMRFFAAQGVQLTGASGPGQTQTEGTNAFSAQNFTMTPDQSLQWAFTTSQPYPANAGGQLRVSPNCAQDFPGEVTGPAPVQQPPPPPPGPQPQVNRTEVVTVLTGVVFVRLRGARRFVRVVGTRAIPDGSEIDARRGRLRLTVANGQGGTETADVAEGRAIVDQDAAARPLTTLRLSEPLACPARGRARAAQRRRRKRRRIYVRTQGANIKTKGRYAEAIARGTAWRTNDQCDATVVQVLEGTVEVTSRAGRVTVTAPRRVVAVRRRRPR
jgi:hypothetical protein